MFESLERAANSIASTNLNATLNRRFFLRGVTTSGLAIAVTQIPTEAHAQSQVIATDYIPDSSPYWWPYLEETARHYGIPRLSAVNQPGKAPIGPLHTLDIAYSAKYPGQESHARDWQEKKEEEYKAIIGGNSFWFNNAGNCAPLAFAGIYEKRPLYHPGRVAMINDTRIELSQAVLDGLWVVKHIPDFGRSVPLANFDEIVEEILHNRPVVFQAPEGWFRAGYKVDLASQSIYGTNFGAPEKKYSYDEVVSAYAIDRGESSQSYIPSYMEKAESLTNPEIKDSDLIDELIAA